MQPQTVRRPVMDVAARPKMASPATPASAAPAPSPVPTPQATTPVTAAVTQAPLEVKAAPASAESPVQAATEMPVPPDSAKKNTKPASKVEAKATKSSVPMALITFTILAMLVLAGLAVTVYITSHSS